MRRTDAVVGNARSFVYKTKWSRSVGDAGVTFGVFFVSEVEWGMHPSDVVCVCMGFVQVPRRNYPMAVARSAYSKRGPLYSNKAVVMRCVRPDQSGITIALHYLNDGNARARFSLKKQEFFVPVVLLIKSLVEITDRELYELVGFRVACGF